MRLPRQGPKPQQDSKLLTRSVLHDQVDPVCQCGEERMTRMQLARQQGQ